MKTFILGLVFLAASLQQVACGERVASSHRQGSPQGDAAQDGGGGKTPENEAQVRARSGEDHYHLANDLSHDRQADEALAEYNLALQAGYDTADLRIELGLLLTDQFKRYPEACDQFRIAAQREPDNWRAHWPLAQTLMLDGRYEEALAELAIAEQLDPYGQSHGFYDFHKAKAFDSLQRYKEALTEYELFLHRYERVSPRDSADVLESKERVRVITEQLKLER
jgi:tetratricopeptide (TPR) repeat protein